MAEDCDIAIVAAGCRFPGADNLEEFWRVLVNGENHVTDIPTDRWKNDAFYSAEKDAPGKIYVNKAGLIKRHDEFDPRPFGISDMEAKHIDPQQRYVLECVLMALEDGGITRDKIDGTRTGVYIGVMNDDYKNLFTGHHDTDTSYSATGFSSTIIAARVSYIFNLQGPCMVLDTACSSALVAVHLGTQAIKSGDCEMALCGGVSSIISPETFIPLCRARMMSATGQCQTFCDTADGYARGEGCGIVILKKLSQALKDGNKIWAVIKTGCNQDGHAAQPITSPSEEQQFQLLEMVYSSSDVAPASIQYIEAHGTGTAVGDPVETNTLGRFFSKYRNDSVGQTEKLLVGSVKTNIGHTESAAGVAGLIKVLLMMVHGKIVPSLHIKKDMSNLNPLIRLHEYNMDIPVTVEDWIPNKDGDRVGCVNSFGFGGSNSHAILIRRSLSDCNTVEESYPGKDTNRFFAISAVTYEGLSAALKKFMQQLAVTNDDLDCISYTSTCRRDHFPYRICFSASSLKSLAFMAEQKSLSDKRASLPLNIVFVYCGVGTTWRGMCSELVNVDKTFRDEVDAVDKYLQPLTGMSIKKMFFDSTTDYTDPFINHISIFACQVGLTKMWQNLGVWPNNIVGQSVGEVAAAYVSGSLDLKAAVDVIYNRSKILAGQTGGAMMVVKNVGIEMLEKFCENYDRKVTIAVYSSPVACTLSGETDSMTKLKGDILEYGKRNKIDVLVRELPVSCAYHSQKVESCMPEIKHQLRHLKGKPRTIPIVSTVTGKLAVSDEFQSGDYWAENIRQPVLMTKGVLNASKSNHKNIFLEIGPNPVLRAHIHNIFKEETVLCIPSMTYSKELVSKSSAIVDLFEHGVNIKWENLIKRSPLSSIPTYTFDRKKVLFLPEEEKRKFQGIMSSVACDHMFLRHSVKEGQDFMLVISKTTTPYVYDHFMSGTLLVPGATYVEAVYAIACRKMQLSPPDIAVSVTLENTHIPPAQTESEIYCAVKQNERILEIKFSKANRLFSIGEAKKSWVTERQPIDITAMTKRLNRELTKEEVYSAMKELSFTYGPSLKLIEHAWFSDTECLVEIKAPNSIAKEFQKTHIHPAVIDSIFQSFAIFVHSKTAKEKLVFPKGLKKMILTGYPQQRMLCYTVRVRSIGKQTYYNAVLLDISGGVICEITDFYTHSFSDEQEQQTFSYALGWDEINTESIVTTTTDPKLNILVFGSKKTLQFTESVFKNAITDFVEINLKSSSERLNEYLECIGRRTYNSILYAPFADVPIAEDTCEVIYSISKLTILCLKDLIVALCRSRIQTPLFVMTYNTQSLPHEKTMIPSLFGSELWGMVRCARQESEYHDIRLLDIDLDNCDKSILYKVINNGFPSEKELKIIEKTIWKPTLRHTEQTQKICTKKLSYCEKEALAYLKSTKTEEISKPFLELFDNRAGKKVQDPDTVRIYLQSFSVHNSLLFPKTLDDRENNLIWPHLSESGFQVMGLEGVGYIRRESAHVNKQGNNSLGYFCFPFKVATYVDVPKECLFLPTEIPHYIPGILPLSVILNNVSSRAAKGSVISILAEKSIKPWERFIETFLKISTDCPIYYINQSDISRDHEAQEIKQVHAIQYLIVLTKINKETIKYAVSVLPNLRHIITLSVFMAGDIGYWIAYKYPSLSVSEIRSEEIFHAKRLKRTLLAIRSVLIKCKRHNLFEKTDEPMHEAKTQNPIAIPYRSFSLLPSSIPLQVSVKQLFRQNCCYIVIGGLTGLGWQIMRKIAQNGGGHVYSISRRKPSDYQQSEIDSLISKTHCCIKTFQSDITSFSSIDSTIKRIQTELCDVQIRGIFNGAGVLSDCLLPNMTEYQLEKVLKPKILGSLNIHLITQNLDLDFFVMHSSVVSIIGNLGQCNYGAANSFIDVLAHYRRSKDLSGQTINWGPLSVGMTQVNPEVESRLRQIGMNMLTNEEAHRLLEDTLISDRCQVALGSFDWKIIGKHLVSTKLRNLIPHETSVTEREKNDTTEFDIIAFQQLTDMQKYNNLFELVKHVICNVFPITNTDILTANYNISSLGVDSFSAMSLINKIFDLTDCKLPIQMILSDQATVQNIVVFLQEHVVKRGGEPNIVSSVVPILTTDANVSFIEKSILFEFKRTKNKEHFVRVVDVTIERTDIDISTWKKLLLHVVCMNPELCRKFIINENDVEVIHVADENIDPGIDAIDVKEVGNSDPRERHSFNLQNELPVKFQIAFDTHCTVLRMILHLVTEDLRTQILLYKDIETTANAIVSGLTLPKKHSRPNIAHVLHPLVNRMYPTLKEFWSTQTKLLRNVVTLSKTHLVESLDVNKFQVIKGQFPSQITCQVIGFIEEHNLTLFQFFISVYQLFLFCQTKIENIPIITLTDLRMHHEQLSNAFGRCLNYVPFISSMTVSSSLREVLLTNSKMVTSTIDNSLYPYEMILDEIQIPDVRKHIRRHRISLDNLADIGPLMSNENRGVKMKNMWIQGNIYETGLLIFYDIKAKMIRYSFGYNTGVCDEPGELMVIQIMSLVEQCLYYFDKPMAVVMKNISSLHDNRRQLYAPGLNFDRPLVPRNLEKLVCKGVGSYATPTENVDDRNNSACEDNVEKTHRCEVARTRTSVLKEGIVRKQTRHGWDHKVQLALKRSQEMGLAQKHAFYFEWTKMGNKHFCRVPFDSVQEIQFWPKLHDVRAFVILTKRRRYIMKTDKTEDIECWIKAIQSAVDAANTTNL